MDKLARLNELIAYWPVLGAAGRVLLILAIAAALLRLARLAVSKSFARQKRKLKHKEAKIRTLESIALSVLRYTVYFAAGIAVLAELQVPTESILASAGIVGLAVGIGAQNLVRDILTGFFILFEDQYSVGDYIETAGVAGYVEEVGLRVTRLRDFSGVIHTVPNGKIELVSNHSRHPSRAMVDVSVAYEEDLSRVEEVLNQLCAEMAQELENVVEGPRVLGVQQLGPSEVVFRIWARTRSLEQWGVEREMRRRIKLRFNELGIEIPYPRRVLFIGEKGGPDSDNRASVGNRRCRENA